MPSSAYNNQLHIPAVTLGTLPHAAVDHNCVVDSLTFCNHDTAVAHVVIVTDGYGKVLLDFLLNPMATTTLIPGVPPSAGSPADGGQWMANGVQWRADLADVVDAHIMARDAHAV